MEMIMMNMGIENSSAKCSIFFLWQLRNFRHTDCHVMTYQMKTRALTCRKASASYDCDKTGKRYLREMTVVNKFNFKSFYDKMLDYHTYPAKLFPGLASKSEIVVVLDENKFLQELMIL
ncbi:MAG: hypothetical protein LBQ79_13070 [Deltaproteobacteria bacterium]|nr:hypothetical protein [Deltaproteobacteria bacterium]